MLKPKTFIKQAHMTVSVQAQKILLHTKFTAADLVEWRVMKGVGLGGNDVAFFLEEMANLEAEE